MVGFAFVLYCFWWNHYWRRPKSTFSTQLYFRREEHLLFNYLNLISTMDCSIAMRLDQRKDKPDFLRLSISGKPFIGLTQKSACHRGNKVLLFILHWWHQLTSKHTLLLKNNLIITSKLTQGSTSKSTCGSSILWCYSNSRIFYCKESTVFTSADKVWPTIRNKHKLNLLNLHSMNVVYYDDVFLFTAFILLLLFLTLIVL